MISATGSRCKSQLYTSQSYKVQIVCTHIYCKSTMDSSQLKLCAAGGHAILAIAFVIRLPDIIMSEGLNKRGCSFFTDALIL